MTMKRSFVTLVPGSGDQADPGKLPLSQLVNLRKDIQPINWNIRPGNPH
jgi:hypothetical protein